ncbi:GNAT family N-acetyltransferase [Frigoribacterium faeni]|uniref:N-acetyltransferase n=1 Tax=Frigoribacterium faeni TaxID=145483 RepID=A0A7W3JHY9_9MICO|nr:GNAT family N-acetyltransferase [Frigoribacterium faeni]MBA8813121.1 GNAT superfamily N-acetyltransferase [Frigoribacterium faeni]BFF14307.1 GNAT family N-acetyltransferase [Microbacterium flavescens]GEK83425.1 N-acetyltransferase [Frigoribacterium faeni]
MEITLRPSTADDLDWLLELRADVMRDDLTRLGVYDEVRVRQRMRDAYDPACTRVIVVDGRDVGSIAVRPTEEARWIEHFYLARALQGRRVGEHVLRSVLAEPGAAPFRLNVLVGSAARRLYERHGFVLDTEDAVDVFMTRRDP